MIRLIILLIILSGCSLNDQLGIWEKKKTVSIDNKNNSKILFQQKIIKKELNPQLKIKLLDNKKYYNIDKNLNNDVVYYNGLLDNISKFKFSKIKNFKKFEAEPAFHKDKVIFFNNKGTIFNLNKKNLINWKKNIYLKNEKKKNPTLFFRANDNQLIVTDNLGKYYSLEINSGNLLWSKNNSAPFNSEIKIDNKKIYVTDIENILRCYSMQDGSEIWSLKTEKIFLKSQKKTSIIIKGDAVIFNNTGGDITAVNKNNGELLWQVSTNTKNSTQNLSFLKTSELISYKDYIFFSNNFNDAYLIDSTSGTIVWKQNINSTIKSTIINGLIFTITKNGFLVITELSSGNILRITDIFNNIKKREIVKPVGFIFGINKIYLSTSSGKLMIINIENGKNVKTIKLDKDVISKPYIFNKNLLLIKDNSLLTVN